MKATRRLKIQAAVVATLLVLAACGDAGEESVSPDTAAPQTTAADADGPENPGDLVVVATTTILGDLVKALVGEDGTVEVLLPVGADPHDIQLSSQDGVKIRTADLVVANGLGLEETLISVFESAREDGARILEVGDLVDPMEWAEMGEEDDHSDHDHDDHADEEDDHSDHDHDDHADEEDDHSDHDHDDHADEEDDHSDHDHDDHADEEDDHSDHDHDDHADEEDDHSDHDHDDHADEEDDHSDHDHDDHADEEDDHSDHDHDDHADEEDDHSDHDHDDHADEEDDHSDHDHHGHAHVGAFDPHFWFDPSRVEMAVRVIAAELIEIGKGVSAAEWTQRADNYIDEIRAATEEARQILSAVPADRRKLVTNHDSFSYFGAFFDFEILDTILAGGTTLARPGTAHLAELVEAIEEEKVPAIFTETTADDSLPLTVAAEFDPPLLVVELYTGSLGEAGSGADTYPTWLVTNARLIAEALTP